MIIVAHLDLNLQSITVSNQTALTGGNSAVSFQTTVSNVVLQPYYTYDVQYQVQGSAMWSSATLRSVSYGSNGNIALNFSGIVGWNTIRVVPSRVQNGISDSGLPTQFALTYVGT